jgi:G3E family GTPase
MPLLMIYSMDKTSKTPTTTPLPINLITGLLGSGKTTAIKSLIKQKPPQENWGILINEFGEIGIDAASLSPQKSLSILEVSGGCICCTAQLGLTQSLNQLLSHPTPLDRILIEPTGLGHPAKIIDTLTQGGFAQTIELAQIICIITPPQLTPERWQKSAVMRDLVTLCDIVFLNKTDTCSLQQLTQAQQVLAQCYPPKQNIKPTQFAQILLSDLRSLSR